MSDSVFRDQVVIVTGASSGIGRELAYQLADQGAKLALAARDTARLEEVAAMCRTRGGEALPVPTDVADETACQRLIEHTCEQYGRLDMLVNNAGIGQTAKLEDLTSLDIFRRVIDVNLMGCVYCTYYALPHLKETQGRLLVISSQAGKFPLPFNASYIASKHAVQGFYDSLRMELAPAGVTVTLILPGWVATEFHERTPGADGSLRWGQKARKMYTKRTMTAERAARIAINAAAKRRREVAFGPVGLGVLFRMIAPGLMDRLIMGYLRRSFRPIKRDQHS